MSYSDRQQFRANAVTQRRRNVHVSLDSRIGEEQAFSLSESLEDGRPDPEDEYHYSNLKARFIESVVPTITDIAKNLSATLCRPSLSPRSSSHSRNSHRHG